MKNSYPFKTLLKLILVAFVFACISLSVNAQHNQGDTITVGSARYAIVSNNLIANPGFEDGFTGWTDATTSAAPLSSNNFNIVNTGGVNNSRYLVGIKNEGSGSAGSIGTGWSIVSGKRYYFSYHVRYLNTGNAAGTEPWLKVSLTNNKTASAEPLIILNEAKVNGGGQWTKNEVIFTNSNPAYSFIVARFRWLDNRLGFDSFSLHEIVEVVNTDDLQLVINEAQSIYDAEKNGAATLLAAIEKAQGLLSSSSPTEVIQAIDELRKAINAYKLANASAENPLDITHLLVNPGFDNNTPDGWRGIGTINHRVVEFYQRTFDMRQRVAGLPAGKYVLKAQGFERPRSNDGGAAYRAGTEQISAHIYAKANSFPERSASFRSLYQHTVSGTGTIGGYLNTMAAASTYFHASAQNFAITVSDILLNQGDTLVIGAKSDFQQSGYWALFDNFRLEYHGQFTADDLAVSINQQIDIAQSLLEKKIQNSVRDQINTAIVNAQQALAAEPLVYDDLKSQSELINAAVNAGNLSVSTYLKLQEIIADAYDVFPTLGAVRAQNLTAALQIAEPLVDDLTATSAVLNKSITDISALIYKRIYVPTWMLGNVNNENNNWSMARSRQSRNWIIFWEPGYGEDPSVLVDGNFRINIDGLLEIAETSFDFYADSLKFITRGQSKSDDYKMIIRLRYTRDWEATGSGVDDMIGLLTLTAWSAQVGGHTLAHEVAHCFQYQVRCDSNVENGWRYGFGSNASGGNAWWEMCAQWQAFKIYPQQQFTDGRFANYLRTAHKHIMHEAPRYDNYFIQDYWTMLHGWDFIGRMWNESRRPEDPVQAYIRMTGINLRTFNDQMWDRAARFATWDIPFLKQYGESRINQRTQPKMNSVGDNFWMIDETVCPENFGYNVIRLNAPTTATRVTAVFEGKAGIDGFRKNYVSAAGWRYGFVALLHDGTRVYSDFGSPTYMAPRDTISFDCPANTQRLWLVVTGAPSVYWRHAWDDDDSNDEQWPYQVKFYNTNLLGHQNVVNSNEKISNLNVSVYHIGNTMYVSQLPPDSHVRVYNVTGSSVAHFHTQDSSISATLASGIYIVNITSGGETLNRKLIIP